MSAWIEVSQRYSSLIFEDRPIQYFERLAELIQAMIELNNELEEKAEVIEPVREKYEALIKTEFGISTKDAKELVIALYPFDEIDDIKHRLPDDIARDIKQYAANERAKHLGFEINDPLTHMPITAAPTMEKSNRPILLKPSHKVLVVLADFLERSKELPPFGSVSGSRKKDAKSFAESKGLSGETFYKTLNGKYGKVKVSSLNSDDLNSLALMLGEYKKALQIFENEIFINKGQN